MRATRGSAREGVRGPPWHEKKGENGRRSDAGDGATRADKKRREKNISAGAKARERKKNIIRAGAKKKYYSGGSEKKFWRQREHNPQKSLRTVETSFFYLFLSGVDIIYWKELQP